MSTFTICCVCQLNILVGNQSTEGSHLVILTECERLDDKLLDSSLCIKNVYRMDTKRA